MSTEEHKQLSSNELGQITQRIGKFFETHGRNVLIGVGAVVAIAAAVIWWTRSATAEKEAGWTRLSACATAKDFADLADDRQFKGTAVAAWARLNEANAHMPNGMRGYFTDRKAGRSDVKAARDAFKKVLDAGGVPDEVREKALYGQAVCLETMSDGDATDAIKAYKLLLTSFPESVYRTEAEQRTAALESNDTKAFYAWFDKQNPKPEDRAKPNDGMPGGHPGFGDRIPGGLIPSLTDPPPPALPQDPVDNPPTFDPEKTTPEKTAPKKDPTDKTPPKKKADAKKSDPGKDSEKKPASKSP
jgi:hypothetical protein